MNRRDGRTHDAVNYYASIEAVVDDGGPARFQTVIIDAVPKTAVAAMKQLGYEQIIEDLNSHFPVLLLKAVLPSRVAGALVDNPGWVELSIGTERPANEESFEASAISFGDGEDEGAQPTFWVTVKSSALAKRNLSALAALSKFQAVADASQQDLQQFDCAHRAAGVAVYDVGQANMSALVDGAEHPLMFFDLGWPLPFFSKSYRVGGAFEPLDADLQRERAQPVVLSHLDWDHWGFAYKSGRARYDSKKEHWLTEVVYKQEALQRPWLIRRPKFHRHKLTATHIHFVLELSRTRQPDGRNVLNFWPANRAKIAFRNYSIVRCSPPERMTLIRASYLRNNESLVLLAQLKGHEARVLLTGDADYPSIPRYCRNDLTGIVAPHHGGAITDLSTPQAGNNGLMVRSTFPGCYRSVPSEDAEGEAVISGWQISSTHERASCVHGCCYHGNRLIPLVHRSSRRFIPRCSCGVVPATGLCLN
ncbi:hypothetical protein ACIPW4_12600 [Pseudomonas sp. NPDC089996]|uniref:hypothetical protein n=1 Tax=Pseudomonas sp. NPDC089996 TaxID=3364474 RepID=UPI0037F96DC6